MVNGSIKQLYNDDSGIAWGLVAVFCLMALAGAMWLLMSSVVNPIVSIFNSYIAQDLVTQKTADAVSFGVSSWLFFPIVIVFGLFAWIVVRAHERTD